MHLSGEFFYPKFQIVTAKSTNIGGHCLGSFIKDVQTFEERKFRNFWINPSEQGRVKIQISQTSFMNDSKA